MTTDPDQPVSLADRFRFVAGQADLRRLWLGRTTSVIGDRMFAVGAIWIAWSLTHSSAGVACIILAESLPFLLWGALRRRVRLRIGVRCLAVLDLLRAALLIVLAVLPLTAVASRVAAVGLVACVAFLTAMFEPAFRSLIPELVPTAGRQAYASFDLGGRLARVAGPLLAAAITWGGSPRVLIVADLATFLVSAYCLSRTPDPHADPARAGADELAVDEGLSGLSRVLVWADGLGTYALIVWWLALPIAAAHHPRGATTYALCIGISAAGGILANLVIGRSANRYDPAKLSIAGWAITAVCIALLVTHPAPLALEVISFICGAALAGAALGFSFHAVGLELPQRNHLFHRDQVVMRAAGAGSAVTGGVALQYLQMAALVGTAGLLFAFAIVIGLVATAQGAASH